MTKANGKEGKEKSDESIVCSECGSSNIKTKEEEYKFEYGVGKEAVELKVIVPLRTCGNCGCSFLDGEAEDLCHKEICRHLGVMSPSQIKDLRKLYNLTQAEFCRITKLGEATMSRWERGVLIQNAAYDNYMFLLKLPLNFERIRKRGLGEEELDEAKEEKERSLTKTIPMWSPGFHKLAKV